MTATLVQELPTFYSSLGDKSLSITVVENNHNRLQNWGNAIAQDVGDIHKRLSHLESIIQWIGESYPEVIVGYKAVQDVEKSVA